MGRAKKRGMDYFPVDVNLMDSTEIKVLTAKFGAEGFYLYMFLMCRIHLGGYYLEVSEDFVSCAAVDTRLKEKTVVDMIELMCAKRLFDRELYEQYQILTSAAIQETYLDVKCKRGRGVEVYREYWLLDVENVPGNLTIISVHKSQTNEDMLQTNEDLSQTNADMSQKKCINKTKENKTEQNETEQNKSLAAEVMEKFNSVCVSLPRVKSITPQRRKAIMAALKQLGDTDISELFRKTAASDWLSGRNNKGWSADFDWVLEPSHLVRIMEGNYDNRKPLQHVPENTDYTNGGLHPNILEMSGDVDPEDYPF